MVKQYSTKPPKIHLQTRILQNSQNTIASRNTSKMRLDNLQYSSPINTKLPTEFITCFNKMYYFLAPTVTRSTICLLLLSLMWVKLGEWEQAEEYFQLAFHKMASAMCLLWHEVKTRWLVISTSDPQTRWGADLTKKPAIRLNVSVAQQQDTLQNAKQFTTILITIQIVRDHQNY